MLNKKERSWKCKLLGTFVYNETLSDKQLQSMVNNGFEDLLPSEDDMERLREIMSGYQERLDEFEPDPEFLERLKEKKVEKKGKEKKDPYLQWCDDVFDCYSKGSYLSDDLIKGFIEFNTPIDEKVLQHPNENIRKSAKDADTRLKIMKKELITKKQ